MEKLKAANAVIQYLQTIFETKQEPMEALYATIQDLRSENAKLLKDLQEANKQIDKLEIQLGNQQVLKAELEASNKRIETLRATLTDKGGTNVAKFMDELDAANVQIISLQTALDKAHRKAWRFGKNRGYY